MISKFRLPDVTVEENPQAASLRWVGMDGICVPVSLHSNEGTSLASSALADVYVSFNDSTARGIHLSRLYLLLLRVLAGQVLTGQRLSDLVLALKESQKGLSINAKVALHFDVVMHKQALVSNESGYQRYPVTVLRELNGGRLVTQLKITVPYSSTCPCSAALSRQALADAFDATFPANKINKAEVTRWLASVSSSIATPHSQRSYAYVTMTFGNDGLPDASTLIHDLERTLSTPVQTAVKRSDEQKFARLNAQNLMFCEDAARRLKEMLEKQPHVLDYWFKVEHQESLHAHNAVAIDWKNNPDNPNAPEA